MKLKALNAWRRVRASFWFLPSVMVLAAVALAFINLYLDRLASGPGEGAPPWLAVAGAESARSILSTIAGSMITVAGVTFSIVIIALTLASSQFGPRLLVGFMEDTGNQVVLGTFISVFTYCLVVLLHLPGQSGSRLLPQISVVTAVLLAILAVGVLIFFFHHISTSIQAGELVTEAGLALDQSIRDTLPENPADQEPSWPPSGFSEANSKVKAHASGYLAAFDPQRLLEVATALSLRIALCVRVGDFVLEGETLALVSSADSLTEEGTTLIHEALAIVAKREDTTDLSLAVDRLTEIAVRGLSPGINDPFTAISAVHRLTASLDELLKRLPATLSYEDPGGIGRVYVRAPVAEDLLDRALGPIRTYGRHDPRILEVLVESLCRLGSRRRKVWDELLLRQLKRLEETAQSCLTLDDEHKHIEACCRRARAALET